MRSEVPVLLGCGGETIKWSRNVGYQPVTNAARLPRMKETSTASLRKPKNSQRAFTNL